jgi:hypothetical protein
MTDQTPSTEDAFDQLVEEVTGDIKLELSPSSEDSSLRLTGLEPILAMLALKAVVGVASGFAGRAAFDKWKQLRTRKKLRELGLTLDLGSTGDAPAIDEPTLRYELMTELTDQGVTVKQAERIVDRAMDRVRARVVAERAR